MNIDECFEIADYLQQTEPVDYEEQRKGALAIWWLIEQNRQLQAKNEALKNARCVACGWNPKLIRPQVKEEND